MGGPFPRNCSLFGPSRALSGSEASNPAAVTRSAHPIVPGAVGCNHASRLEPTRCSVDYGSRAKLGALVSFETGPVGNRRALPRLSSLNEQMRSWVVLDQTAEILTD